MLYKKDFKVIAEIIKKEYNSAYDMFAGKEFISKLADYLSTKNPNFDRKRFLTACGVN